MTVAHVVRLRLAGLLSAPAVPAQWRGAVLAGAAASVLAFGLLTGQVLEKGRALRVNVVFDEPIQRRLIGHQHLLEVARAFGSRDALVVGLCVLVAGSLVLRRGRTAVVVLLTLPGAGALTERVLKPLVTMSAPSNSHPGYPSGHATGAAALATTVLLLLLPQAPSAGRQIGRGLLRLVTGAVVVALAAATAVAVVALDTHNAASALGGCLVACAVVLIVALGLDAACSVASSGTSVEVDRERLLSRR